MNSKIYNRWALTLIALATGLSFAANAMAANQTVADSGDSFAVNTPTPNSRVTGTVNTKWKVLDDDRANVPYELKLMSGNCLNYVGTIKAGTVAGSATNTITTSWSSSGPIQNQSVISDGKYCMQLCVTLLNAGSPYSACNLRVIFIRNSNNAPRITTSPPTDRSILSTESWQYNVNATDPDGDSFSFRLAKAPSFLRINSSTGLITTKSVTKTPGEYIVKVVVEDSFGGRDTQTFTLVVVKPDDPDPVDPVDPVDQPNAKIEFVFPAANDVLKGAANVVEWEISEVKVEIKSMVLSYKQTGDESEWVKLADLTGDQTSYNWDVTALPDGNYLLQLEVTYTNDEVETFVSDPFEIRNKDDGGTPDSLLQITDISPENLAEIESLRPQISGKFVAPTNGTVDLSTFTMFIDDKDLTERCTVDVQGFKCDLTEDLAVGAHQVSVQVEDNKDRKTTKDWSFVIKAPATPGTDGGDGGQTPNPVDNLGLTQNTLSWIALICCLALILLAVPWILYTLWKRRNETVERETVQVNYEPAVYDQPEVVVDPTQFTSYEDYFNAVTPTEPQTVVNYYEPEPSFDTPQPVEITPAVISTPDYSTPEVVVNTQSAPAPTQVNVVPEDPNNPSWLNPVEDKGAFSDPLPASTTTVNVAQSEPSFNPEPLAPAKPDVSVTTTSATSSSSKPPKLDRPKKQPKEQPKEEPKDIDPFTASLGETDSDSTIDPFNFNPDDHGSSSSTTTTTTTTTTTSNPAAGSDIDPFAPNAQDTTDDQFGSYGYGKKQD